jgi:hypothetical protein
MPSKLYKLFFGLSFDLQRFTEGEDPTPEDDNADDSGAEDDEPADDQKPAEQKPFAVFKDKKSFNARLMRAKREGLEELSKETGLTVEQLKALAAKERERLEGEKTELDKAKELAQQKEREAEEAKQENKKIRLEAKALLCLTKAKAINPEKAIKLLDLSGIDPDVTDDDGAIEGLVEKVEALKESDPYLFESNKEETSAPGGALNPKPGSGSDLDKAVKKLTDEEKKIAAKTGMTLEKYAARKFGIPYEEKKK